MKSLLIFTIALICTAVIEAVRVEPGEYAVQYVSQVNAKQNGSYLSFKGQHKTETKLFGHFLPVALIAGAGAAAIHGLTLQVGLSAAQLLHFTFVDPWVIGPILAAIAVAAIVYVPLYALRISNALTLSKQNAVLWNIQDFNSTFSSQPDAFTMENAWRPGHWKHGKFIGNSGKRAHLSSKKKAQMIATQAPEGTVYLSVVQPDGKAQHLYYQLNKVRWHNTRKTRWRLVKKENVILDHE